MLKFKLYSLEGLDAATAAYYRPSGNYFLLDVDGFEKGDIVGLKLKKEQLLSQIAALRKHLEASPAVDVDAANAALAKVTTELETFTKEIDARVAAAITEAEAKAKNTVEKQTNTIRKLRVDNVAQEMAARIGLKGSEALLIPHITNRLAVEERDGEYVTVARDANGNVVPLEVLEASFRDNPAFAPILRGVSEADKSAHAKRVAETLGTAASARKYTRQQFDALDAGARMSAIDGGAQVVDH